MDGSTNPTTAAVRVCQRRLKECLSSAAFWVEELPRYADRQQRSADTWAVASGMLAALTSLSIWPVMRDGSPWWVKGLVSAAAFVAAVCALVPRVKNFGEMAGQARELSSRYGELKGELIDLVEAGDPDQTAAHDVVARFQATKEKKDMLRGLPDRAALEQAAAIRQRTDALERADVERRIRAVKANSRLDPQPSHEVATPR